MAFHVRYVPVFLAYAGRCPCAVLRRPEGWMWRQDNAFGYEMMDDLETGAEFLQEVAETKSLAALDNLDRAEELRASLDRVKERASWLGEHFERRNVAAFAARLPKMLQLGFRRHVPIGSKLTGSRRKTSVLQWVALGGMFGGRNVRLEASMAFTPSTASMVSFAVISVGLCAQSDAHHHLETAIFTSAFSQRTNPLRRMG